MVRIIMAIFLVFLFTGCMLSKPDYHTQMGEVVYLDPYYSWSNNIDKEQSRRSITLRIINRRYVDVKAKVVCSYDDLKFGEKIVFVEARNDKTFMIHGFARNIPDRVFCRIVDTK